ncbi:MAG: S-methyl-5'-thioadenosine phosphorylase [Candidatus Fermentibacteraceae bacterium]|nr:S-methyl-5'-thioadenosine phosphorylase [Candidatus Fermentibacteraceae bacterium]
MNKRIGIIGGSGVYSFEGVKIEREMTTETPFGRPSAPLIMAEYDGIPLVFLARHGEGHALSPSEVPYAANIYAMKHAGVRKIISVSAVGSLQEQYHPRHFVVPDQIFDRTKGIRRSTYFGGGLVGHIGFGDPFCRKLSGILADSAEEADAIVYRGGTLVCMEGPAFSTRAESNAYRRQGFAIIGMTALPEAKLAREAGICYSILGMVTDYDVWHESEEDVSVEAVMANVRVNTVRARRTIQNALKKMDPEDTECSCHGGAEAIEGAIMTAPENRSYLAKEHLKVILER